MTDDERLNRLDRILVYATIEDESFDMEELLVRLKPLELSYSSEEIRQSLTRLELAFIFQRKEGRYQFRVPLFRKMSYSKRPTSCSSERSVERVISRKTQRQMRRSPTARYRVAADW
jgi:hypothetical protein